MSCDSDMVGNLINEKAHAFCPRCYSGDIEQKVHRPEGKPFWGHATCKNCGHSTSFRLAGYYIQTAHHL